MVKLGSGPPPERARVTVSSTRPASGAGSSREHEPHASSQRRNTWPRRLRDAPKPPLPSSRSTQDSPAARSLVAGNAVRNHTVSAPGSAAPASQKGSVPRTPESLNRREFRHAVAWEVTAVIRWCKLTTSPGWSCSTTPRALQHRLYLTLNCLLTRLKALHQY
jgi:hypothetical protein